jgi:hypothetical protein
VTAAGYMTASLSRVGGSLPGVGGMGGRGDTQAGSGASGEGGNGGVSPTPASGGGDETHTLTLTGPMAPNCSATIAVHGGGTFKFPCRQHTNCDVSKG